MVFKEAVVHAKPGYMHLPQSVERQLFDIALIVDPKRFGSDPGVGNVQ